MGHVLTARQARLLPPSPLWAPWVPPGERPTLQGGRGADLVAPRWSWGGPPGFRDGTERGTGSPGVAAPSPSLSGRPAGVTALPAGGLGEMLTVLHGCRRRWGGRSGLAGTQPM